jgi:hypothetical protein
LQAKYSIAAAAKDSFSGFGPKPCATFQCRPSQGNIKAIEFQRLAAMGWFGLFSRHSSSGFQWVNSTHFR